MTRRAIFTDSDEKRFYRDADDSDDLLPLDHPAMKEALADWNAKYGKGER